jgi:hypothetical protein
LGDLDDEEMPSVPLWDNNSTTEDYASSLVALPSDKSINGCSSGKDLTSVNRCEATPAVENTFKEFLTAKLQEKPHVLAHLPPVPMDKDEVIQVDERGNSLQEEEVKPENLLLEELHARQLRGELNSIDDVRSTFDTVMGAECTTWPFCMTSASGSCKALIQSVYWPGIMLSSKIAW